tara:strand:+ start:533 stop:898 length:366 start_codon:yes stop_codon:yes gene_type:complete
MPTYKVPQEIRNIAARAIEQNLSRPISKRAAYKDEGGKRVAGTGMRTARRLVSGRIDEEQLILMRAWFARHGASEMEKKKRKDKTSKASIAWRLWGGSGAVSFVNGQLRAIEAKRKKEAKK